MSFWDDKKIMLTGGAGFLGSNKIYAATICFGYARKEEYESRNR